MIIKYQSNFKFSLFATLVLLIIFPFLLLQIVHAGCEDGYYNARPGGVNPTSDPTQVTNCSDLSLMNNVEARSRNPNGSCTSVTRVTYNFCRENVSSVATASGRVYLYHNPSSGISYYFKNTSTGESNSSSGTDASPIDMQISITAGQTYYFKPTGAQWNNTTGWRKVNPNSSNAFVLAARADATARGYTIIAEQIWADNSTCTVSQRPEDGCSLYDSYDYDDTTVIIAVDNPEPVPTCANHAATLSVYPVSGTVLYHGEQANFNASVSIPNTGRDRYEFIGNQFTVNAQTAPSFNISLNASPSYSGVCTPQAGINSTRTTSCFINNRNSTNSNTDFTSTTRWIHTYRVCNNSGCSPTCSAESAPFVIYPYPGFMKTSQNGTVYTRGAITQTRFPTTGHVFSSRLFLSGAANNEFTPADKLIPATGANSLYRYTDKNNDAAGFFNTLKTKLTNDQRLNKVEYLTGAMPTIDNRYLTDRADLLGTNPVDLLYFNSSITIDDTTVIVNCRKPTIFLVNGDINFNKQFQLLSNSNSACLFIALGSVNFNTIGSNDRYDGFFIANNVLTSSVGKITIKGGVVLQNTNTGIPGQISSFRKNINANVITAGNIQKTTASEEIVYEGARYIKVLGDYLNEPFKVSIREIQFINN